MIHTDGNVLGADAFVEKIFYISERCDGGANDTGCRNLLIRIPD